VLCLEQPDLRLEWRSRGFPARERSLLDGADVGLFVEPPREAGLTQLAIETTQMHVLMAVGHRLAQAHELRVADILDETFPGAPDLHPQWRSFWTLEDRRGGPATSTEDRVASLEETVTVVAAGAAIATIPASVAGALAHPGVIAIPLSDGPSVATRLVWPSDDENPIVDCLTALTAAMTSNGRPHRRAARGHGRRFVKGPRP
jgi:DNA-binding transcriptional LysR family regulator